MPIYDIYVAAQHAAIGPLAVTPPPEKRHIGDYLNFYGDRGAMSGHIDRFVSMSQAQDILPQTREYLRGVASALAAHIGDRDPFEQEILAVPFLIAAASNAVQVIKQYRKRSLAPPMETPTDLDVVAKATIGQLERALRMAMGRGD